MKYLALCFSILLFSSCINNKETNVEIDNIQSSENTITTSDTTHKSEISASKSGTYIEYYPNGKNIKFKGPQDKEGKRHGKWLYFSPEGDELSMTMFEHGKKNGHSIVHHPNGAIYYYGEYNMDKKVGIWKTFDTTGKPTAETDYDEVDADNIINTK